MSESTFGLSRLTCTLSNTMSITCLIPFARWHPDDGVRRGPLRRGGAADAEGDHRGADHDRSRQHAPDHASSLAPHVTLPPWIDATHGRSHTRRATPYTPVPRNCHAGVRPCSPLTPGSRGALLPADRLRLHASQATARAETGAAS